MLSQELEAIPSNQVAVNTLHSPLTDDDITLLIYNFQRKYLRSPMSIVLICMHVLERYTKCRK